MYLHQNVINKKFFKVPRKVMGVVLATPWKVKNWGATPQRIQYMYKFKQKFQQNVLVVAYIEMEQLHFYLVHNYLHICMNIHIKLIINSLTALNNSSSNKAVFMI